MLAPGGPAVNRLAAFDAVAPQVWVSLADLTLYVRGRDLEFAGAQPALTIERSYSQENTVAGAFGPHWSLNLDERITVDGDSSVVLVRGSGRSDRFALSANAGGYFAATATSDVLSRDSAGKWTLKSLDGTTRSFGADGRLVAVSDATGVRYTLDYNNAGNLATVRSHGRTAKFEWEGGRLARVSDDAGRVVSYSYNGDGYLTQATDATGLITSYQYEASGLLSSVSYSGAAVTVTYSVDDPFVSVATVTSPDGAVRTYDVPRSPREIRVTDAAGNSTLYGATANGSLESVTNAYGNRTSFEYDSAGRRTRVTNGAGEVTRFEYDSANNLTALVDAAGNRSTAEYAGSLLARIVDPNGSGWTFGYDDAGNLSALASPLGAYGSVDRNAAGAITKVSIGNQSNTYQYNADGLITRVTDTAGNNTTYSYDGAGRVTQRTDGAGATVRAEYAGGVQPSALIAGDTRITTGGLTRDALGRVTASADPFGNQVTYTWNGNGQIARLNLPGNRAVTYDYDRAGRLSKVSDWAGNFAVYRYDDASYPASVNVSGGPVTVYQYDAARNLKAIISTGPDGNTLAAYRYTLDAAANRTAISALEPLNRLQLANRGGISVQYDAAGNLVRVQGGPELTFGYDAFGRLQQISGDTNASYVYDAAGLRAARTLNGVTRRYLYDWSGAAPRVVMENDESNNPVAYYVYGTSLLWKVTGDGQTYFYHFDGDGNTVALSSASSGTVNRYRYDAIGQLDSSEEGTANPFRAQGAAGVMDDGNGVVYLNGNYRYPALNLTLRGRIDLTPPYPALPPQLSPPGLCLLNGIADCALAAPRRVR